MSKVDECLRNRCKWIDACKSLLGNDCCHYTGKRVPKIIQSNNPKNTRMAFGGYKPGWG